MRPITKLAALACFALLTLPAFAAGGSCPTLSGGQTLTVQGVTYTSFSAAGVTSCFYASKSAGSDSNAGTSESIAVGASAGDAELHTLPATPPV